MCSFYGENCIFVGLVGGKKAGMTTLTHRISLSFFNEEPNFDNYISTFGTSRTFDDVSYSLHYDGLWLHSCHDIAPHIILYTEQILSLKQNGKTKISTTYANGEDT